MKFTWGCFGFLLTACILQISHVTCSNDVTSRNNYTVTSGNVTCVVMTAAIQLKIPYIGKTGNLSSSINIPANAFNTGLCQLGHDTLTVYFNNDWQLSIIFSNASHSTYKWRKVSLTYRMDSQHFPNISSAFVNNSYIQDTEFAQGTMVTTVGSSYSCAETVLQLNGSITMNITALQYRALGTDSSTAFQATGVEVCSRPEVVPDTDVALAVSLGIALGVAIVGVVMLYIVASKIMDRKTVIKR